MTSLVNLKRLRNETVEYTVESDAIEHENLNHS